LNAPPDHDRIDLQAAHVVVVIPALNEEEAIGRVLDAIPDWVNEVIVADNGSTDRTAETARAHGARVVAEPRRGYGAACLAGLAAITNQRQSAAVVVFLDADFSDDPTQMGLLVRPIIAGVAEMVIGSRTSGQAQRGALTIQQRVGNRLACLLVRWIWSAAYTDLGPFRAIDAAALSKLNMTDRSYGWTIQMQVRAARQGLRTCEVPVSYRKRIGKSKISGTVRGVMGACVKILGIIFIEALATLTARRSKHTARHSSKQRLIVFTRYPQPGKTKTRLIPALGPQGAAEVQRGMTGHMLACAAQLQSTHPTDIEVRFVGGDEQSMAKLFGSQWRYVPQGPGDLGAKMATAFADAFTSGIDGVLIIGSDCPQITAALLGQAFDALAEHDLVLGPTLDGGYYLIGLQHASAELFDDIAWGGETVLSQTLHVAERLGLSVKLLEELGDVDVPADLHRWRDARQRHAPHTTDNDSPPPDGETGDRRVANH
jgi:rSAM/selenodomain-associated transferase 1